MLWCVDQRWKEYYKILLEYKYCYFKEIHFTQVQVGYLCNCVCKNFNLLLPYIFKCGEE